MPTLPKLILAVLLTAGVPALAQDNNREPAADPVATENREAAPAEDSQEGPKLVEPARTVKEALERRSAEEAAAAKELEAARKAYEDRLAAANQRTVADLTVIARRSVADGQLADASKAWQEVLRIDQGNQAARKFFETIGRLDEVEKRLAKALVGDDRKVWIRETTGKPGFVLQPSGEWLEIRSTGKHKMWSEIRRDDHTIEMKRPDGQVLRLHRGGFYWSSIGKDDWTSGARGHWK